MQCLYSHCVKISAMPRAPILYYPGVILAPESDPGLRKKFPPTHKALAAQFWSDGGQKVKFAENIKYTVILAPESDPGLRKKFPPTHKALAAQFGTTGVKK